MLADASAILLRQQRNGLAIPRPNQLRPKGDLRQRCTSEENRPRHGLPPRGRQHWHLRLVESTRRCLEGHSQVWSSIRRGTARAEKRALQHLSLVAQVVVRKPR